MTEDTSENYIALAQAVLDIAACDVLATKHPDASQKYWRRWKRECGHSKGLTLEEFTRSESNEAIEFLQSEGAKQWLVACEREHYLRKLVGEDDTERVKEAFENYGHRLRQNKRRAGSTCIDCHKPVFYLSKRCRSCANRITKNGAKNAKHDR